MTPVYRYRAVLDRMIDADTFILNIDLGFRVHAIVPIRLRGVDAPELKTPEGEIAKLAVAEWFMQATVVVVETYRDQQSFARWIADVYLDGQSLAERLIASGHIK